MINYEQIMEGHNNVIRLDPKKTIKCFGCGNEVKIEHGFYCQICNPPLSKQPGYHGVPIDIDTIFETMPTFYDRKGKPLELLEWAKLCEFEAYRVIKQEEVGKYFVSTVWVGFNMCIFRDAPKQLFETMIFLNHEDQNQEDPIDRYQDRYSTEEEALEGHAIAVKIAKGQIPLPE